MSIFRFNNKKSEISRHVDKISNPQQAFLDLKKHLASRKLVTTNTTKKLQEEKAKQSSLLGQQNLYIQQIKKLEQELKSNYFSFCDNVTINP